jgi:hypothetical protein
MKPGRNYYFPGASSVTEYPLRKRQQGGPSNKSSIPPVPTPSIERSLKILKRQEGGDTKYPYLEFTPNLPDKFYPEEELPGPGGIFSTPRISRLGKKWSDDYKYREGSDKRSYYETYNKLREDYYKDNPTGDYDSSGRPNYADKKYKDTTHEDLRNPVDPRFKDRIELAHEKNSEDIVSYMNYVASDTYLKRLMLDMPEKEARKKQESMLRNLQDTSIKFNYGDQLYGYSGMMDGDYPFHPNVLLYPRHFGSGLSLTTHEMAHASRYDRDAVDNNTGGKREDYFSKREQNQIKDSVLPKNKINDEFIKENYKYYTSPEEYHSRLNSLRRMAYDLGIHKKFGEDFTKEQLEQIKKLRKGNSKDIYNEGEKLYDDVYELLDISNDDEKLINNLNTIAANRSNNDQIASTAKNGGKILRSKKSLRKAQEGGEPTYPYESKAPIDFYDYLKSSDVRGRIAKQYFEFINPNPTNEELGEYVNSEIDRRIANFENISEIPWDKRMERYEKALRDSGMSDEDIQRALAKDQIMLRGIFDPRDKTISVNPTVFPGRPSTKLEDALTTQHELYHGMTRGQTPQETVKFDPYTINYSPEKRDGINRENYDTIKGIGSVAYKTQDVDGDVRAVNFFRPKYDERVDELGPRLFELREFANKMGISEGGRNLTEDQLNQILNFDFKDNSKIRSADAQEATDLLNNIRRRLVPTEQGEEADTPENQDIFRKRLLEAMNYFVTDQPKNNQASSMARQGGKILKSKVRKKQNGGEDLDNQRVSDVRESTRSYVASQEYLDRLRNFMSEDEALATQKERLRLFDNTNMYFSEDPDSRRGYFVSPSDWKYEKKMANKDGDNVYIMPYTKVNWGYGGKGSALTHELAHSSQSSVDNYTSKPFTIGEVNNIKASLKQVEDTPFNQMQYDSITSPEEYHARMYSLRRLASDLGIHKKFGESFTKEQLNKIKEELNKSNSLLNDYRDVNELLEISNSDDNLVKNLNTIAAVNTASGYNNNILNAKQGGKILKSRVKKMQGGGDPRLDESKIDKKEFDKYVYFNLPSEWGQYSKGEAWKLFQELPHAKQLEFRYNPPNIASKPSHVSHFAIPIDKWSHLNVGRPYTAEELALIDLREEMKLKGVDIKDLPTTLPKDFDITPYKEKLVKWDDDPASNKSFYDNVSNYSGLYHSSNPIRSKYPGVYNVVHGPADEYDVLASVGHVPKKDNGEYISREAWYEMPVEDRKNWVRSRKNRDLSEGYRLIEMHEQPIVSRYEYPYPLRPPTALYTINADYNDENYKKRHSFEGRDYRGSSVFIPKGNEGYRKDHMQNDGRFTHIALGPDVPLKYHTEDGLGNELGELYSDYDRYPPHLDLNSKPYWLDVPREYWWERTYDPEHPKTKKLLENIPNESSIEEVNRWRLGPYYSKEYMERIGKNMQGGRILRSKSSIPPVPTPYTMNYEDDYEDYDSPEEMANGGIPQRYKNLGFTKVGQKRQSTRPGKKWMVLSKKGNQYKVVHGGDPKMKDFTQHGSAKRKEAFWNRHGGKNSAKANDPFSPLYYAKHGFKNAKPTW